MSDSCDCYECQAACARKPGVFLPGEAEKLADYLDVPIERLFRESLAVDYYLAENEDEQNVFMLSPAPLTGEPGRMFPYNPLGTCTFLENGRCKVYEARPYECREYHHAEPEGTSDTRKARIVAAWADHQDQIARLLGRKPEVPDGSLVDVPTMIFGGGAL